jgi:hypothetical protein
MDVNQMRTSGMERIRRLFLGKTADRRATVSSALASAGRVQPGGSAGPGPFDEPPNEAILLAPDLPWELQEDDDPDGETEAKDQGHSS